MLVRTNVEDYIHKTVISVVDVIGLTKYCVCVVNSSQANMAKHYSSHVWPMAC